MCSCCKIKQTSVRGGSAMAVRLKKSYFVGIIIVLCVLASAILLTGFSIKAGESSEAMRNKYFTSITVEEGDSLWTIATEYRTKEYSGIDKYINEVKRINNLDNEKIKTGENLIVPYYSDEVK